MAEYSAKVVSIIGCKELTGKEKVALKNFADMIQLDEVTQEHEEGVLINVDFVAIIEVHNEKADTKDYEKQVYVDKDGQMYISGSQLLFRQYKSIYEDMEGDPEEWGIKVIRKESPNYKGKDFLTCVIV